MPALLTHEKRILFKVLRLQRSGYKDDVLMMPRLACLVWAKSQQTGNGKLNALRHDTIEREKVTFF